MNHRRAVVVVGAAAVLLASAVPALSWIDVTSSRVDVAAVAGTLDAPGALATSVDASELATGVVRLEWVVPNGVAPTAYGIERQTLDGPWEGLVPTDPVACTAGTCTAVDASAEPGASYRYRVRSLRGQWVSDPGDVRMSASLVPDAARLTVDTSGLRALALTPPDLGLLAVGDDGLVMACEGDCTADEPSDWRVHLLEETADLRAVDAPDRDEAWAVGDGAALRCDEDCIFSTADWEASATTEAFLAGRTATAVLARGSYVAMVVEGTYVYSADGGMTWQAGELGAPPGTELLAVTGSGPGQVVVTGAGGYVGTCSVSAGICGEPGTFVHGAHVVTLVAASWVSGESAVLAVDETGAMWAGTVAVTGTSWVPDAAQLAGPPPNVRFAVARSGGARHVWAVSPPVAAPGTSAIWHLGSAWVRQTTDTAVQPAAFASVGGVHLLARAPHLPSSGCGAPALRTQVVIPAGPSPAVSPVVTVRVGVQAADPSVQAQLTVSVDGASWSAPQALDVAGGTSELTVPGTSWDTSSDQTLHVCVQADGPYLGVDTLHIGVQQ